jgi:hypothetical protein
MQTPDEGHVHFIQQIINKHEAGRGNGTRFETLWIASSVDIITP